MVRKVLVSVQEQTQTFYKFKFRPKFVKEMFDVAIFAATEKLLESSQETVEEKPKKVSKKKEAEVKAVSKVKDGSNEQQTTEKKTKSKKNA